MIRTPTRTQPAWIRVGASLVLAAVLALTGCSGPGAAQEPTPGQTVPSVNATQEPSPGQTVPSVSATTSSTPESDNTVSADPSTTMGPPPATTPVPPPTPGSIHETVDSRPAETKDPVSIEKTATFDQKVVAEITGIEKIEDPLAGMPNEVGGPALAITIKLTNDTSNVVSLDSVVVEVLDSADAPGGRMTGNPYAPVSGSLPAGKSVSGTYVYTVAKDKRDPISVVVTLNADEPVVLFRGPVG